MTSQKKRIADLTEQLDRANKEINRLVIDNNEQDFEISRLKKLVDSLYEEKDICSGEQDTTTGNFREMLNLYRRNIAREIVFGKSSNADDRIGRITAYVVVQTKTSMEITDHKRRRGGTYMYTDYNVYDEYFKEACSKMGKQHVCECMAANKIITTESGDRYFFTPAASAEDALRTYLEKRKEKV